MTQPLQEKPLPFPSQPYPATIEGVIVLALLSRLIATDPESSESCSSR